MNQQNTNTTHCRLCDSRHVRLVKNSDVTTELQSSSFAITDSHYGKTLDIYACEDCGLLQSLQTDNITQYYQHLEDPSYEESRKERSMQAKKILKNVQKMLPSGNILDVGAGSGILVEQALHMGYQATGIEPSIWLKTKAVERNLPVIQGVLPNEQIRGPYDAVTLIDVIEHVEDPLALLREIRSLLKPNGLLVLNTPDVHSFFARALGWKWWHFRIAHISYFNKKNLHALVSKTGFEIIQIRRPSWFFGLDYLVERIQNYLPKFLHFNIPSAWKNIVIPLNLFDSFEVVCKKTG
ncbi:MAG: class I SAM-dependent methyltransferase [Patescibacteria group bacterium]